jgi:transcriptional regulator with XRE-family HTH domain
VPTKAGTLPASLLLIRTARRLSLAAVGAHVGVSASTVARWEKGLYQPSSVEAERYAEALGITQRRLNALITAARAERRQTDAPVNAQQVDVTA